MKNVYDIIVVGGGHAGVEAVLASARLGKKVLLLTLDFNYVASLPCNPSIGGPAKGVVVREIDSLGGEMAHAADATYLQMKMLNTAKGPGVQCLRAQADKIAYAKYMQKKLREHPNVTILETMGKELIIENNFCKGILDEHGEQYFSQAVILTTGTYLKGKVLIGHTSFESGPDGQRAAIGLSKSLMENGISLMRLKTGTPPRLKKDTIDYSNMEIQSGSEGQLAFSFDTTRFVPLKEQQVCYLIHTAPKTHEIIQENLKKSAMYGGMVEGIGPRYCPSIEDKIVKFSDKDRHQIFVEPESMELDTIYLQGFSTSMPIDIQDQMIRSLPGFKEVEVIKYAYAIEYDGIDPTQLKPTLELKKIQSLFCAGQINGTSGYEEAAGQGLLAGINAVLKIDGKSGFVLRRDEAYLGVMIDDLVTKGTKEPYRLLTSRAEFRLLLRHDNADLRLKKYGYQFGLIGQKNYEEYLKKVDKIQSLLLFLQGVRFTSKHPITQLEGCRIETGVSGYELLKRPEVTLELMLPYLELPQEYNKEIFRQVEIEIKYEGYIKKQKHDAEELAKLENVLLPLDIDYHVISNLALEARQKLEKIRPLTIGQASRISGVNPSDITILMMRLRNLKKE